jgi:hypothetical protein
MSKGITVQWDFDKKHLGYVIDPVEFAAKELERERNCLNERIRDFCVKRSNYRVYRTLTSDSCLSSMIDFTFKKRSNEIAEDVFSKNTVLQRLVGGAYE